MTERERYSTRGLFYRLTGDYQQCVNEYGEMIARYASDVVGHNQRALCLSQLRDMRGAVEEMRKVVDIVPKRVIFRVNLALYSNYGQKGAAVAAAERALSSSNAVHIRFLAARVFVEAGDTDRARARIAALASELQAEPQSYAKILEAEVAMKSGNARQAIKTLAEATALLDTWIGHYVLGRAYLEAGAFAQADSEFDRCIRRRGEALALFLDEEPTYGIMATVYYYQGLAREGLKTAGFAESFRTYVGIRGKSSEDVLVADVRKRLRQ